MGMSCVFHICSICAGSICVRLGARLGMAGRMLGDAAEGFEPLQKACVDATAHSVP